MLTCTTVREHGPVEQGLRLVVKMSFNLTSFSQRARSSRTRIKTCRTWLLGCLLFVREHGPVEQGLRRLLVGEARYLERVREHGPVEQGLRRNNEQYCHDAQFCQRARSSRTRIKTL